MIAQSPSIEVRSNVCAVWAGNEGGMQMERIYPLFLPFRLAIA
jgi:hypothetical protein